MTDQSTLTIEQLEAAMQHCRVEEYYIHISMYRDTVNITLSKYATGQSRTEVSVKGEGPTVRDAFANALANFPKNPLDGASKWATNRLESPEPIEDGTFTETQ